MTIKIKNNKIENEKKFINVKLYGEKPSIVKAPSKKGAKNITKNLLFNKADKLKSSLSSNRIYNFFFNSIHFKIIIIFNMVVTDQMQKSMHPSFIEF